MFDKIDATDESLQLVTGQIFIGLGVLVGYKLGLFKELSKGMTSLSELAESLQLSERGVQSLISCASSQRLISSTDNLHRLSSTGKKYLTPESPYYYGPVFDLLIDNADIMSISKVESSILHDKPLVDEGKDIFSNSSGLGNSASFVAALHQKSMTTASNWPLHLNLENFKTFIDIGGGSGIHAIEACRRYKNLEATICDRSEVLKHTKEYVIQNKLEKRIRTVELDFWHDCIYPKGDIHFFGDILHDWNPKQCKQILQKSFKSLNKGGKILIHEMIFDSNKDGPALTSAYNIKMMLWTHGQQYTFDELKNLLQEVGFTSVRRASSSSGWSIVTADMP